MIHYSSTVTIDRPPRAMRLKALLEGAGERPTASAAAA